MLHSEAFKNQRRKKSRDTSGGHSNGVFLTFLLIHRDGHWDDKHQAQTCAHPQAWHGQGVWFTPVRLHKLQGGYGLFSLPVYAGNARAPGTAERVFSTLWERMKKGREKERVGEKINVRIEDRWMSGKIIKNSREWKDKRKREKIGENPYAVKVESLHMCVHNYI